MSDIKKYYWLKLKEGFFDEKHIKFLRKLPDGDRLVIVYLKMQLKSLRTEGLLKYDQILPNSIEELAMILDEEVSIVSLAVQSLVQSKAIEILDDGSLYMIAMQDLIGKEGSSAERVREFRKRQKQLSLQCNTNVIECNTEIEKKEEIKTNKKIDKNLEVEIISPDAQEDIPYSEIVDYLNLRIGSHYKSSSSKTRTSIHARWMEGFRLDDFKNVIDKKSKEWGGTDLAKYLRPETLFGTKFESYLNQVEEEREITTKDVAKLMDWEEYLND